MSEFAVDDRVEVDKTLLIPKGRGRVRGVVMEVKRAHKVCLRVLLDEKPQNRQQELLVWPYQCRKLSLLELIAEAAQ